MTALPATAPTEHIYTSGDGLRLFYVLRGARDARPVLCLPGLTRNSRDFESLAARLAATYRVITPDLRGRGRSEADPKWANYQPGTYVEDALRLLDELAIARCAVIGTSLGGLVGMMVAATQSQRVAGLVLNDIGPALDPRGIARIKGYAGKLPPVRSLEDAAAQARQIHGYAFPDFGEEDWLAFAGRTCRQQADGTFGPDIDPNIVRAFNDPSASAPDLWPLFRLLAATPLLTIRGALSDLFAAETLERMQAIKPDMQTLVVANRGHAPTLDEPECRRAIGAFLATLP